MKKPEIRFAAGCCFIHKGHATIINQNSGYWSQAYLRCFYFESQKVKFQKELLRITNAVKQNLKIII